MSTYIRVEALAPGDKVQFGHPDEDPIVTILRVKADPYGYDVLYQHNGSEPRWRGFDETDKVVLVEAACA